MPYAANQSTQIYYEVEGSGPPLMLAHGLGYSGEDWRDFGYVDLLKKDFRLILVDHRGHGKSDRPHDPEAYAPEMRVRDHVAVLDHLGISRAHFCGYSLGGALGYKIARWAPDRFRSLTIGGEDPYPPSRVPIDGTNLHHTQVLSPRDVENPVVGLLRQGGEAWVRHRAASMTLTPEMKARYGENDFQALMALRQTPHRWVNEVRPLLPRFPLPSLLYAGEAEDVCPAMKEAAREMPGACRSRNTTTSTSG